MQTTFAGIALGDETMGYAVGRRRLVRREEALLWTHGALVRDDTPAWVWEVSVTVRLTGADTHAVNRAQATLGTDLSAEAPSALAVADGEGPATIVTFPTMRFDALDPHEATLPGDDSDRLVTLRFTGADDPVYPA